MQTLNEKDLAFIKENIQLIEEQYNTIYDCCEKASKLIK